MKIAIVKALLLVLVCVIGVTPACSYAQQAVSGDAAVELEQQRIQAIQKASPSVVCVFAGEGLGGGSGVLISPEGYALTNYHVVSESGPVLKAGLDDGNDYDAILVGVDPTGDLAVIQLLGREEFPFSQMVDSDQVRVGDPVFAMGNPFLLASDFSPTSTFGIVAGTNRYQDPAGTILEYTDCIQTDASINPGNSGGPLFDINGDLIGINGRGSFEKRGRVHVGSGYAISINQAKRFLSALKSGLIVDHATLGATVVADDNAGVMIESILTASDAYRRGLRVGDQLLQFAGRPLRSVNQLKNLLGTYPAGWRIPIVYRRGEQRLTAAVQLQSLHAPIELQKLVEGGLDGKPREANPHAKPIIIPDQYKHLVEEKTGFSNYAYNRQAQKQALLWQAQWNWGTKTDAWQFRGVRADEKQTRLIVAPFAVLFNTGEESLVMELDSTRPNGLSAAQQALLKGMSLWQQFSQLGRSVFDEMHHWGTRPLDGKGSEVDVLVSLSEGMETTWYYEQATHQLRGFDLNYDPEFDPVVVRLGNWNSTEAGVPAPESMLIRIDEETLFRFTLNSFEISPAPQRPEQES